MQRWMSAYWRCLLALGGVLLALLLHVGIFFAAYWLLRSGFELLGMDPSPLGNNPLVGWIFRVCGADQATSADLLAAALAASTAIGFFFAFQGLSNMRALYLAWRHCRRQGLTLEAQQATDRMIGTAVDLALCLLFVGLILAFDIHLFTFRAITDALGLDSIAGSPDILKWPSLTEVPEAAWLRTLVLLGAWAYVAMELIACWVLEKAIAHLGERRAVLEEIFQAGREDPSPETPQPQLEPETPRQWEPSKSGGHREDGERVLLPSGWQPTDATLSDREEGELPLQPSDQSERREEPTVEIIGAPGERVTLAEAKYNPRYVVDPQTRTVWLRSFYEAVRGDGQAAVA